MTVRKVSVEHLQDSKLRNSISTSVFQALLFIEFYHYKNLKCENCIVTATIFFSYLIFLSSNTRIHKYAIKVSNLFHARLAFRLALDMYYFKIAYKD